MSLDVYVNSKLVRNFGRFKRGPSKMHPWYTLALLTPLAGKDDDAGKMFGEVSARYYLKLDTRVVMLSQDGFLSATFRVLGFGLSASRQTSY